MILCTTILGYTGEQGEEKTGPSAIPPDGIIFQQRWEVSDFVLDELWQNQRFMTHILIVS